MIDFAELVPTTLMRTSLTMAAVAMAVGVLLWIARPRSPMIHRIAWSCVLLQGLLVAQWSFSIEWYDAPVATTDDPFFGEDIAPIEQSLFTNESQARTTPARATAVPPTSVLSASLVLTMIWLGGMLAIVVFTTVRYLYFILSLRSAKPASHEFNTEWQQLLRAQKIRRKILLVEHESQGPMLCRLPTGYRVVVPRELWSEFTAAQRRAILRHELAHYRRGDIWKNLGARLLALPHWFNPLAWWAARKFEEGGEWACDETLADAEPREVPGFAQALLEMVVPSSRYVGASAARGGSLGVRLRRLLASQKSGDSIMKRFVLFGVLLCLVAIGLFKINLVAREPDESSSNLTDPVEEAAPDFEKRVSDVVARIDTGDDDLLKKFQDVALTRAGNIVIRDRAGAFEEEMRSELQSGAIPQYIEDHYIVDENSVQLREGQTKYRDEMIRTAAVFNEDIERIKPVIKEMGKKIAEESEVEKLVARFLNHEAAPTMFYVMQLRERIRPDAYAIEEKLGDLFVADEDGNFVIRASRRDEASEILKKATRVLKGMKSFREELKIWAEDIAETDEFHKDLKQLMGDGIFAAAIAAEMLDDGGPNFDELSDRTFDNLENATKDTGDGLVVREEVREEVEEKIGELKMARKMFESLRGPLNNFAAKVKSGDPLEDGWREILKSDLACVKLSKDFGAAAIDPEDAIKRLLGEVLQEGDDGKIHVTHENPEEVSEFIRNMFRQYRNARRKGRPIKELAEKLDDKELAEALGSSGGMYQVGQSIRRSIRGGEFDGLQTWVEQVFEEDGDRLVLRDEAREEIENMLRDAEEVERELSKDDF